MTTEVNRDAPLYEAELPVRLVGAAEGAAVVEGERHLTVRLLEGTRPIGGAEAGGDAPGGAGGARERLLHLEVADAQDPYFVFSLDVGEGDFHALRREHALLVDFGAFPAHFVDLLRRCEAPDLTEGASTFCAALERPWREAAKFAVVEANRFKQVEHLGLRVEAGDDATVKAYLAGRLAQALLEESRRAEALADASEAHAAAAQRGVELEAAGRDLEDRLRHFEAAAGAGKAEQEAAHRERLAAEVSELARKHAEELRQERARLASERDGVAADRDNHRDRAETAERSLADSSEKLGTAEVQLSRARDAIEHLEARGAELADAAKRSEAERSAHAATAHGLELRLAALTQRAEAAEQLVARADAAGQRAADQAQQAALQRKDLDKRLETREQQLAAAAAEITRGNAIIERLSEQARAQQQKLRLRADVVKQQERRVADASRDRDDARHQKDLAVAAAAREADRRGQAEKDLERANKKLDEAADLLEHNQRVIQWLNAELHASQVGRAPAVAVSPPPKPAPDAPAPTVDDAAADYFARYGGVASDTSFASSRPDSSFLGRGSSGQPSFLHETTPPPDPSAVAADDYAAAPAAAF